MAQPNQGPNVPQVFLGAYQPTAQEMTALLVDAANEAERLIPKMIEQNTFGSKMRAAQTALVLREVRAMLAAMWGDYLPLLKNGMTEARLAAAGLAAQDAIFQYLKTRGADIPHLRAAILAQARSGMATAIAKASNGIPLSTAVYYTQALAQGWVDRRVRNGLVLGKSAKEIAKDVRDLIRPDTAGGVSYAAMRLARTEINNAFHTENITRQEDKPWVTGMRWHLSRSHPEPDECDALVGVHAKGAIPGKPHPQCFCYVTPEQIGEDEWIDRFLDGEYNDYIDEKVYTHLPPDKTPC